MITIDYYAMARLQDLPPELLRYIFSFINRLDTLCILTRVSKGFRTNAEPSLYHTLDINQVNGHRMLLSFVKKLLERPPLAKHVRKLSLAFWPKEPLSLRKIRNGWTMEDCENYATIVGTLDSSKSLTAGLEYGRKLSTHDSTQYILILVLLSLVPGLQEFHFEGDAGLSVPYSLIQKVAEVSWTSPIFHPLAVLQPTDTIDAPRRELVSLSTAVTNIKLDGGYLTKNRLEKLIRLPQTLKSFNYLMDPVAQAEADISPSAIVDALYQRHGQSLRSLTIGFNDRYVGWEDDETRLYNSTCLRNFTNLIHLKVTQHMLLKVKLDTKMYVFPNPLLLFSNPSKVRCPKQSSKEFNDYRDPESADTNCLIVHRGNKSLCR